MGLKDWIKGMLGSTFQLNEDDIVVFLVGPSGSGKSLFVNEVTKSGVTVVGPSMKPSTKIPQAIRCELTDDAKAALRKSTLKNIVFVDTPSFQTDEGDRSAEKEMSNWLTKAKCKSTLVGIIYLHRVETDPKHEPIQDHLDSFASTFPQSYNTLPQRLHCVLSYESRGKPAKEKIADRRETFLTQLGSLKESRTQGTGCRLKWDTSFHPDLFGPDHRDTAWQAVVTLFSPREPDPK